MPTRHLIVAATLIAVTLAGCSAAPTPDTPSPTAEATSAALDPTLVPQVFAAVTAGNAGDEALRLEDAIRAIIDPAVILSVDDGSQLARPEGKAPYFAFYRAITLDPSVDAATLAGTIMGVLAQSSWTLFDSSNENDVYIAKLASGPHDQAWFAVITAEGSTITVQIASPDIVG